MPTDRVRWRGGPVAVSCRMVVLLMSLKDRLQEAMKDAMKAKAQLRLDTIRMVRASVKNAEIDRRHELSDDEVIEVLARERKQRRDAIAEFGEKAPPQYREKLEAEIAVISEFLPEALSEDELRSLVREAVAATGAQGPKGMGKVMGYLMPKMRGRADGKLVNQFVREVLG